VAVSVLYGVFTNLVMSCLYHNLLSNLRDEMHNMAKRLWQGPKWPEGVPYEIEFRDSLPVSVVGKVLRRVLRDEELKKRKK